MAGSRKNGEYKQMQATPEKYSWYDVPGDVKQLLILASDNWGDSTESERYVNEALAKAEDHLDVLVGAYRYFFYKNKSDIALQIAHKVIDKITREENLPSDWERLKPILLDRKNEPQIRLYINAYAATGFLLARQGKLEEAKLVTERVKECDHNRESCATTIFEVLTRPPEEDDD